MFTCSSDRMQLLLVTAAVFDSRVVEVTLSVMFVVSRFAASNLQLGCLSGVLWL
jgi:hypothetical protein